MHIGGAAVLGNVLGVRLTDNLAVFVLAPLAVPPVVLKLNNRINVEVVHRCW